jgi:hypothetical protein
MIIGISGPVIVGISGLAGSGKDVVASILKRYHSFETLSFSDPMKRFCKEVLGFTDDQLWGPSPLRNAEDERFPRYTEEEWSTARSQDSLPKGPRYLSPRHALQALGTEWGRNCYPDIWVDYAIRTAKDLLSQDLLGYTPQLGLFDLRDCSRRQGSGERGRPSRGVAIPDVRFRNEMNAIQREGGKVVRIIRPGAGLQGAASGHLSETEQTGIPDSEFDFVILNDSTLEELPARVRQMLRALGYEGSS